MALKPLQGGKEPLGQFDGLDTEYLTLKGGEVGTFTKATADKTAFDQLDGYVTAGGRVAVTKTLASGARPLMLLDEGTVGYGTMFGTALGGAVGQIVPNPSNPAATGGLVIGPSTAYGSGKVTCWDKPGLYAVTLDAVAADLAPTTSLAPGAPLYATTAGLLTSVLANAFETAYVVGNFVEFTSSGSLVTTPSASKTQVVLHFHG